jgi:hypothetical protein
MSPFCLFIPLSLDSLFRDVEGSKRYIYRMFLSFSYLFSLDSLFRDGEGSKRCFHISLSFPYLFPPSPSLGTEGDQRDTFHIYCVAKTREEGWMT